MHKCRVELDQVLAGIIKILKLNLLSLPEYKPDTTMQKILLVFLFTIIAATSRSQSVRVVENSRIAKIAAKINGQEKYAITIGKTIFINCKKEDFYSEPWWVKHEMTHVEQYQKHGILPFLSMYLFYSLFNSYDEIPFEKEAQHAEYLEFRLDQLQKTTSTN